MMRQVLAVAAAMSVTPFVLTVPATAAPAPTAATQRDPDQPRLTRGPAYPRQAKNTNIVRVKYSTDPDTGTLTARTRFERLQASMPNYEVRTRLDIRDPRTGEVRYGCKKATGKRSLRDNTVTRQVPASCFRTERVEVQLVRYTSFEATDYRDTTPWLRLDVRP